MVEQHGFNAENPSSKIILSISCRNLVDLDVFSKTDPEVHVYLKNTKTGGYFLLGKTEMILNNLNPDFVKTLTLDYFFEKEQWIKFEVYDVDANSLELIGNCETTIAKIIASTK